ncbi:hypothetical protein EXIGLDRAFT_760624 [Exidia glandulosa HHB12029]|uniref:Uncharacterized protein n=1 Tax=Exidia glandulosa HHB12029 TaxID=1314781 RepID=A0A165P6J0_EXIGL|nr:hypothetical protein EXIGLDRAFT_760624 [Exidia glandulosa HHB12029]
MSHIQSHTFSQLRDIVLPPELHPGAVALEAEYNNGSRSVALVINPGPAKKPLIYMCHFSKIKLFQTLNMSRGRLLECSRLFDRVTSSTFPLSAADVAVFGTRTISGHLHGLSTVSPRVYNQNLANIHQLIRTKVITEFFVVHIADSRASVYHWNGTSSLGFGDSLGHVPLPNALSVFNWVLDSLGVPRLVDFAAVTIAPQPSYSGSCAVACCNTVEHALGLTPVVWTAFNSAILRDSMIYNFVKYDILMENAKVLPVHYVTRPVAGPVTIPLGIDDFYAWHEWNLRWPTMRHPALHIAYADTATSQFGYTGPSHISQLTAMQSPLQLEHTLDIDINVQSTLAPNTRKIESDEESDSSGDIWESPESLKDVKQEPVDAILPGSPMAIDLTTPPRAIKKSTRVITDLITPPVAAEKHKASPLSPALRRKRMKPARALSIISISSDEDDSKPSIAVKSEPRSAGCWNPFGKPVTTGCAAHINTNRVGKSNVWSITTANYEHNHPCTIPVGATALRPPTKEERSVISQYATDHMFSRHHVGEILQRSNPDSVLDPRQISNVIHAARAKARAEVVELGGDFRAVQASLDNLKQTDPRWTYFIRVDSDGKVSGLFWQSPDQVQLSQQFGDILLNDNAANRNQYQFALNIGVIIDGCGSSRNVFYVLHDHDDW